MVGVLSQSPDDPRVLVQPDEPAAVGEALVLEVEQHVAVREEVGAVPDDELVGRLPQQVVLVGKDLGVSCVPAMQDRPVRGYQAGLETVGV